VAAGHPMSASGQGLRERLAGAIEFVQSNCVEDVDSFCSRVTPGEGRILVCMQAHEDRLSRGCQIAVYRASRQLESALHRVEKIADACWSDIEAQCGDADAIGQCVERKSTLLSMSCQKALGVVRSVLQGLPILKGLPAYSADGTKLGSIANVVRGADGKVQAVHVEVGHFLGIGNRVVKIDAGAIEQLADRINLRLTSDAVRALPEAGKQ
jgi:hypothetical protein